MDVLIIYIISPPVIHGSCLIYLDVALMYLIGHALSNKEEYTWKKQLYAPSGSALFGTSEKSVCARIFLIYFMLLSFN